MDPSATWKTKETRITSETTYVSWIWWLSPLFYQLEQDPSSRAWSFTDDNGDHVSTDYDRLGRTIETTDQRGVVHEYEFDRAGRLSADIVSSLGSSGLVDGTVRGIGTAYDDMGRVRTVTNYSELVSQWAGSLLGFSTQWSDTICSAAQAVGAPTVPAYGDFSVAWAPATINNGTETLTLGYATPVYASGVTIRENLGNGYVTMIEVRNAATGTFEPVWAGTDPSQPGSLVDFAVSFAART